MMLQWWYRAACVWLLDSSVFTAAELEVPDVLGARYSFISFLSGQYSWSRG